MYEYSKRVRVIMMVKFLLTLCLILSTNFSFAVENDAINFMAEKMVKDFRASIELYNTEKKTNLPVIEKTVGGYTLSINKNIIRFSIGNYLNKQLYINDDLIPFSKIIISKTSFLDLFLASAFAENVFIHTLDAPSAKILLEVLSTFGEKLEKIGWNCTDESCKKEVRENNLIVISYELFKRKKECKQQLTKANESISLYKFASLVSEEESQKYLSFLESPEFKEVKDFMEKVVNTNRPAVTAFMKDYMGMENKYQYYCMEVFLPPDLMKAKQEAVKGPEIEKTVYLAKSTCIALEDLRSCLKELQAKAETINNMRREKKLPVTEEVPDVKKTFDQAKPK